MVGRNSEMSLDEVLLSIKKMVIDDEPPVLDLTDMISPDGSVIKVKKPDSENPNMSSFLRLVQENANSALEEEQGKENTLQLKPSQTISNDSLFPKALQDDKKSGKKEIIPELIREIATPLIKRWINENLPGIVEKIVTEEIYELFKKQI